MKNRRSLLAAATGLAITGCTAPGDPGNGTASTDTTGVDDTRTATPTEAELDLREANVVGVAVESNGDEEYRFSVTLIHDDDGENGFANWWQVETRDGERLGRRELAHAHGTREFTRSETITVPDDHRRVVVRGHDRTHGYGGRAAIVTTPDGDATFVRQGSDPRPLTQTDGGASDEPTDDAPTDTIGY